MCDTVDYDDADDVDDNANGVMIPMCRTYFAGNTKSPFLNTVHSCRNENLKSIKGHNSITNFQKMTGNNPNLDLVNSNAFK